MVRICLGSSGRAGGRWGIGRADPGRADNAGTLEFPGTSRGRDGRSAMVDAGSQGRGRARGLNLALLIGCRRNTVALRRGHLFWRRARADAVSAVEAYAFRTTPMGRPAENVADMRVADVVDRIVVEKHRALPIAAFIAFAAVSEPIVDPTIKPDGLTPIAFVEDVCAAAR